jgi:hypothetical protein
MQTLPVDVSVKPDFNGIGAKAMNVSARQQAAGSYL